MTRNSARRVSKTGLAGPQVRTRQRTRSPQLLQLLRKESAALKDNEFRAELGRAGVSQTHPLQQARQRRSLRGMGAARTLQLGDASGVQVAASIAERIVLLVAVQPANQRDF